MYEHSIIILNVMGIIFVLLFGLFLAWVAVWYISYKGIVNRTKKIIIAKFYK